MIGWRRPIVWRILSRQVGNIGAQIDLTNENNTAKFSHYCCICEAGKANEQWGGPLCQNALSSNASSTVPLLRISLRFLPHCCCNSCWCTLLLHLPISLSSILSAPPNHGYCVHNSLRTRLTIDLLMRPSHYEAALRTAFRLYVRLSVSVLSYF